MGDITAKRPPLLDQQMSYEKIQNLARSFDAVTRRMNPQDVSEAQLADAMFFVGWTRGFAEALVLGERSRERKTVTRCVEKDGYDLVPFVLAQAFLTEPEERKPKNTEAQSYVYGYLAVRCMLMLR